MSQSIIETQQLRPVIENLWQYSDEALTLLEALCQQQRVLRQHDYMIDDRKQRCAVDAAKKTWEGR